VATRDALLEALGAVRRESAPMSLDRLGEVTQHEWAAALNRLLDRAARPKYPLFDPRVDGAALSLADTQAPVIVPYLLRQAARKGQLPQAQDGTRPGVRALNRSALEFLLDGGLRPNRYAGVLEEVARRHGTIQTGGVRSVAEVIRDYRAAAGAIAPALAPFALLPSGASFVALSLGVILAASFATAIFSRAFRSVPSVVSPTRWIIMASAIVSTSLAIILTPSSWSYGDDALLVAVLTSVFSALAMGFGYLYVWLAPNDEERTIRALTFRMAAPSLFIPNYHTLYIDGNRIAWQETNDLRPWLPPGSRLGYWWRTPRATKILDAIERRHLQAEFNQGREADIWRRRPRWKYLLPIGDPNDPQINPDAPGLSDAEKERRRELKAYRGAYQNLEGDLEHTRLWLKLAYNWVFVSLIPILVSLGLRYDVRDRMLTEAAEPLLSGSPLVGEMPRGPPYLAEFLGQHGAAILLVAAVLALAGYLIVRFRDRSAFMRALRWGFLTVTLAVLLSASFFTWQHPPAATPPPSPPAVTAPPTQRIQDVRPREGGGQKETPVTSQPVPPTAPPVRPAPQVPPAPPAPPSVSVVREEVSVARPAERVAEERIVPNSGWRPEDEDPPTMAVEPRGAHGLTITPTLPGQPNASGFIWLTLDRPFNATSERLVMRFRFPQGLVRRWPDDVHLQAAFKSFSGTRAVYANTVWETGAVAGPELVVSFSPGERLGYDDGVNRRQIQQIGIKVGLGDSARQGISTPFELVEARIVPVSEVAAPQGEVRQVLRQVPRAPRPIPIDHLNVGVGGYVGEYGVLRASPPVAALDRQIQPGFTQVVRPMPLFSGKPFDIGLRIYPARNRVSIDPRAFTHMQQYLDYFQQRQVRSLILTPLDFILANGDAGDDVEVPQIFQTPEGRRALIQALISFVKATELQARQRGITLIWDWWNEPIGATAVSRPDQQALMNGLISAAVEEVPGVSVTIGVLTWRDLEDWFYLFDDAQYPHYREWIEAGKLKVVMSIHAHEGIANVPAVWQYDVPDWAYERVTWAITEAKPVDERTLAPKTPEQFARDAREAAARGYSQLVYWAEIEPEKPHRYHPDRHSQGMAMARKSPAPAGTRLPVIVSAPFQALGALGEWWTALDALQQVLLVAALVAIIGIVGTGLWATARRRQQRVTAPGRRAAVQGAPAPREPTGPAATQQPAEARRNASLRAAPDGMAHFGSDPAHAPPGSVEPFRSSGSIRAFIGQWWLPATLSLVSFFFLSLLSPTLRVPLLPYLALSVVAINMIAVTALIMAGFYTFYLVYLFNAYKDAAPTPVSRFAEADLPPATIQLPVYNEVNVVERLIESAVAVDYPREKLQIQVLDDSTDETTEIGRRLVEAKRQEGHNIGLIHRDDRTGYKAGALANGLLSATGELVAIFDADFIITPDFLRQTVHFFTDPHIAVVQARWDHLNRNYSLLTALQAIGLDGHMMIEQTAKNRAGYWIHFQGTAGIWRKKAIDDAGGWQSDTETEDGDLSYRAQLRGWRFVYLKDHTVPAELPSTMRSYLVQQMRWQRGGIQVMKKLIRQVLRADIPWRVKVDAVHRLTYSLTSLAGFVVSVLLLPSILVGDQFGVSGLLQVLYLALFVASMVATSSWTAEKPASSISPRSRRPWPRRRRWPRGPSSTRGYVLCVAHETGMSRLL
jgi:cellulose synthase/poly-beta-1,6-N-acetylglucosamine synthase-like glycosyltransferase